MARRIVALILGMTVLGLVTSLLLYTKEAGIEVDSDRHTAEPPASLTIRVVASSDGSISVDGRPVDPAELADEIATIRAGATDASLPEPSFIIVGGEDIDTAELVTILEAMSQAGATNVSLETDGGE